MNKIRINQIGTDGDNNAFFPSPGGGKICTGKDGKSTFVAYASASGAVTLSFDGYERKGGLPGSALHTHQVKATFSLSLDAFPFRVPGERVEEALFSFITHIC